MAGHNFERQETSICHAIEQSVKRNNKQPIRLVTFDAVLPAVFSASKYDGRSVRGSEAYTDIVLECSDGITYNVSCKGQHTPSLAGGGVKGIELAKPGLARSFIFAAHTHLLYTMNYVQGAEIPNIFGRVSENDKFTIAAGNALMGGPVDYIYVGPMEVEWMYDDYSTTLVLNGRLIPTATLASSRDFYFRTRARRHDQRFEPDLFDKDGLPRIYGKSPSKGDIGHRLVVQDYMPQDAIVIEFEEKEINEVQGFCIERRSDKESQAITP